MRKLLIVAGFLLFSPLSAFAAISMGTSAVALNSGSPGNTTVSLDSGANRVAVIWVLDNITTVTAPTINGVALTKVTGSDVTLYTIPNTRTGSFWYLVAPATGSQTVAVTSGAGVGGYIWVLDGADQTSPVDSFGQQGQQISSASATLTVSASGSWMLGGENDTGGGAAGTGDLTHIVGSSPGALDSAGTIGTGSQTGGVTFTGTGGINVIAIKPVATAITIKSILGLVHAFWIF